MNEPDPPQVGTMFPRTVRYHIHTTVFAIYQLKTSSDWWVHFEGSREALSFGEERPEWKVGDKVHITFVKEE